MRQPNPTDRHRPDIPSNVVSNHQGNTATVSPSGYNPNHIPKGSRTFSIILSSILIFYGLLSLKFDDMYIPGKRTRGLHMHGEPMWIMLGAFACAVANLLSIVIDHYDRRNNEINYRRFAKVTRILGWVLFGLAIVLDIFVFKRSTR